MTSAIKQRNPNPLTQSQVTDYVFAAKVTYTDDHSVTALEVNKKISLGPLTAAAKTFTLPQITALNDGAIYGILNDSYYQLTLACNAADHVWNSGDGYGLDMYGKGCMIWVQADYNSGTRPVWDVIMRTGGGKVMIEGAVLHEPMGLMGKNYAETAQYGTLFDLTGKHIGSGRSSSGAGLRVFTEQSSKFWPSCLDFDGTTAYVRYEDSTDWGIFGDQVGHKTVSFWIYFDASGSSEYLIAHYEDANNRWHMYKDNGEALFFQKITGGSADVNMNGGSISTTTWTHIAAVINGTDVGIYINGTQVAYDGAWSADTFSGSLYIGQKGDSSVYFDGRMQDILICYNNIFNAAPNSGLTDSFTVPAAPLQVVM